MYNALFREFLTHMMEDPRNITACMHLHFIAKNIERMGDHAPTSPNRWSTWSTGKRPGPRTARKATSTSYLGRRIRDSMTRNSPMC
jgi:phosphate transport system protein